MSDPLIRLRGQGSKTPPPIDAIRSRAARIERRRHLMLGSGGGLIAVIALSALFAGGLPGGREPKRDLADALRLPPTPAIVAGTASPPTEGAEESGEQRLAVSDVGETTGGPTAATISAPPSRSGSSGSAQTSSGESDQTGSPALEVTLEVSDQSLLTRRYVFTLSACNKTGETVEATFPSGQRYDFAVGRDGEVVWQWSEGQVFTQEFGTESWEPGECKSYQEIWDGRDTAGALVEAGTYQAEGLLASDPQVRSGVQDFCVESC